MKQHGMALVVALVITLIIGIIAVAVGKTALQNQQNAAGEFDTLTSYTLAQSAMNSAERLFRDTIVNHKERIYSNSADTISSAIDGDPDWWREDTDWSVNTVDVTGLTLGSAQFRPKFRIEQRQFAPLSADLEEKNGRQFFRITSRAVGPGGAIATLQTYISVMAQKQE